MIGVFYHGSDEHPGFPGGVLEASGRPFRARCPRKRPGRWYRAVQAQVGTLRMRAAPSPVRDLYQAVPVNRDIGR